MLIFNFRFSIGSPSVTLLCKFKYKFKAVRNICIHSNKYDLPYEPERVFIRIGFLLFFLRLYLYTRFVSCVYKIVFWWDNDNCFGFDQYQSLISFCIWYECDNRWIILSKYKCQIVSMPRMASVVRCKLSVLFHVGNDQVFSSGSPFFWGDLYKSIHQNLTLTTDVFFFMQRMTNKIFWKIMSKPQKDKKIEINSF